ncbi:S8 family serine peptidase [Kitasatospora sp. NPDC017646]|uniref:S8 family serine peptidase n=1 Tax=Kitasatospora sp. NPDC017646 TaxID=3364024 RepID=UPI0037AEE554
MGRTNGRRHWRAAASLLLAAGIVGGPVAAPAFAGDSIREDQWHLDAMHAPEMWQVSKGAGIVVAVIDGGFKLDHPDLVGQFLPGKDFSGSSGGVGSYVKGHATQMAGLIAGTGKANGGKGAYGLAPGAKILPLKIANGDEGSVLESEFMDQIGQAVTYAVGQGAKVINVSQGTNAALVNREDVEKLNKILAWARAKGSLVFASVGNEAQSGNPVEYPGALPNVVGVGAVDRNGTVTAESEHGPQVTLVAPGMDMIAACTESTGYCKGHGTSDATAVASASAALVWSVHPDWAANQILRVLINTASKPKDGSNRTEDGGYGAVRPRIALTDPGDPGPADVSPLPTDAATPSAAASPSASASVPVSSAPSPAGAASGAPTAQPKAEVSSGSGSGLPIVGGVVAGLLVVVGVVFAALRRRKAAVPPVDPQQQLGAVTLPPPPSHQPAVSPEDNPYAR